MHDSKPIETRRSLGDIVWSCRKRYSIRDSTPPRLVASANSDNDLGNFLASSSLSNSNEKQAGKPKSCVLANSYEGWSGTVWEKLKKALVTMVTTNLEKNRYYNF